MAQELYPRELFFIRDAETEKLLRDLATPLAEAAHLDAKALEIHIIVDSSLNAFVNRGLAIYLHTGLITQMDGPYELASVLAHELGHVVGGDVLRGQEEMGKISSAGLLLGMLSFGLAIAGNPDAGMGALMVTSDVVQKSAFKFTRTQESGADRYMVRLMRKAHYPLESAIGAMRKIQELEKTIRTENFDPYLQSHPVGKERIQSVELDIRAKGKDKKAHTSAAVERAFTRVQAKVFAFTQPLPQVELRFGEDEGDLAHRYGRAIYHYRANNLESALSLMDDLVAQEEDNPYFHELQGQILYEMRDFPRALASLERAVSLAPFATPIRMLLGHVQLESGKQSLLPSAEKNLQQVLEIEPQNGSIWKEFGKVLEKQGKRGESMVALAEFAWLQGDFGQVRSRLQKAEGLLTKDTPAWYRLQSLQAQMEQRDEEEAR